MFILFVLNFFLYGSPLQEIFSICLFFKKEIAWICNPYWRMDEKLKALLYLSFFFICYFKTTYFYARLCGYSEHREVKKAITKPTLFELSILKRKKHTTIIMLKKLQLYFMLQWEVERAPEILSLEAWMRDVKREHKADELFKASETSKHRQSAIRCILPWI